jgi:hypothetical protein
MAKPKRMSDILASSAEHDVSAAIATATPPYSSEGPTLPLIEGNGEHTTDVNASGLDAKKQETNGGATKEKNGKLQATKREQPINTNHPGLYEPWTLLPREILGPLLSQSRLADTQNAVPIVCTKNQNIKSAVVRLKTYLGAYVDQKNPMEVPVVLKEKGSIIAILAQGEGTAKLVTIVDLARRVVKPDPALSTEDKMVQTWRMYMSLASVEIEFKERIKSHVAQGEARTTEETQEEEAFEPMEIDVPSHKTDETARARKVPVLTVWMSRKEIPAFKEAFGEQTFAVQTLPKDD